MKKVTTMISILALSLLLLSGCAAKLSVNDQANLDKAIAAADSANQSAVRAEAAADRAEAAAQKALSAAKRTEGASQSAAAAAADAKLSAEKAAKAFEMSQQK